MDAFDSELLQAMTPRPGPLFQGFSAHTTPDQAKAMFRQKYGADPATVIVTPGTVLAGPVPKSRLWRIWDEGTLEREYPIEAERPGRNGHGHGRAIDWWEDFQKERDYRDQQANAWAALGGY